MTDLVMPGSDGQELLERIRAQSDEVPVLLFGARGGVSDAVSALKAGADDFISSSGAEIEDVVERLGRSRSAVYRMIAKYGISLSAPRTKS